MTTPNITEPELNTNLVRTKDDTGNNINKKMDSPFDEAVFQERIKIWVKTINALDSTLKSIYNIS